MNTQGAVMDGTNFSLRSNFGGGEKVTLENTHLRSTLEWCHGGNYSSPRNYSPHNSMTSKIDQNKI